jgi:hypothetical protein
MSRLKSARGAIGTPRTHWIEPCSTALIGGLLFHLPWTLALLSVANSNRSVNTLKAFAVPVVTPPESVIRSLNMEHTMAFRART